MATIEPTIICQKKTCKTENPGTAQVCSQCGEPLPKPMKIFVSYSHEDADLEQKLMKHMASLQRTRGIFVWHDRDIDAGNEWEKDIDTNLLAANIILLLISADFIASPYCYSIEMKAAMKRQENGEARVIPIILRPTELEDTPFMKLQALPPPHGKPVSKWSNIDEAFMETVKKIRDIL